MKTLSANTLATLAAPTATLARCLKITRTDSGQYFFTTHDRPLEIGGNTYLSVGGFNDTSTQSATGLSVDNLDIESAIDAAGITETDIIAGRFDFARFELFDVDYTAIADGQIPIRAGVIGEYSHTAPQMVAELRGMMQYLAQNIGRLHMRRCDADLGDSRCGVSLGAYTVTGTVTQVTSRQQFELSTAPATHGGLLTFTSGGNNGLSMEIRSITGSPGDVILALPMPFDVEVGDSYSAYRGCFKNLSDCRDVFANVANFRGFPYMVGGDEWYSYPDAK